MKQNLIVFTITVLLLINITGCSVVRFAETRMGEGLKKAGRTKMDLDFQLGFNPTDQSLRVTLEHRPYEIYKPRITLTDLGMGLASLGLLGKVLYDNWDHDYTFTFIDDTFDWYGSEPWEKAVMIAVPVDILLYWGFSYPFDRKAVRDQKQPLTDHRYRIDLPDHGNIGKDYLTTTGQERIYVRDFLSQLGYPSFLRDIESLKFRVSTEISAKQHKRDHTISPVPSPPPPPQVEIQALWVKDRLRVGEKATLKITVRNTNKDALEGFTMITEGAVSHFNNWALEFGDIAPGATKTRALGFSTEVGMSGQEVSVKLRFETTEGIVHEKTTAVLQVIE